LWTRSERQLTERVQHELPLRTLVNFTTAMSTWMQQTA
jgi:hypothetical protein